MMWEPLWEQPSGLMQLEPLMEKHWGPMMSETSKESQLDQMWMGTLLEPV